MSAVRRFSSIGLKARAYIFQKQFEGLPKSTDLKLVEENLPVVKDGEFLAEAVYLSLDPYMRAYAPFTPLGGTFMGSQLAKVLESKNPKFPEGSHIVGDFGWRTHTVTTGRPVKTGAPGAWLVPDLGPLPLSLALGTLGMPGNTAYFGLLELCAPKAGETVLVSGAAGAVGIIVGQIAKIKGCKVIGVAGSDAKVRFLTHELGFDQALNYKDPEFYRKLGKIGGVDCYFDNVGGEMSTRVLNRMNDFGRVAVCGAISGYNHLEAAKANGVQFALVSKQLKMEGFLVTRWGDRWYEGIRQNLEWVKEGQMKYKETVTEGFENMFKAFVGMLEGENLGKALVKV